MASDLISREALLEELGESLQAVKGGTKWMMGTQQGLENAIVMVKEAPAVDAVEVVRCKDCKHCFLWKIPFCDAEIGLLPIPHNIETWYCPLGERKENAVD